MLYGTGHRLRGITIRGHGCLEYATIMHSPRTYDGAKSEVHAVDLAAVDIALLLEPATVDARLVGLVLVAVDGGQTSTLASRYPGNKPLVNLTQGRRNLPISGCIMLRSPIVHRT